MNIRLRESKKGIIALTTLMISTVLLILIVTLLLSLQGDKHSVLRQNSATENLYIAEAGLAEAVLSISQNNAWEPTAPVTRTLPNGGKYTIVFQPVSASSVPPDKSVNNLSGYGYVNGPRGDGTVPPRTADVVVTVEANGRTERFEALISRGFSEPVSVPLLSSGRIVLKGGVEVSGIESMSSPVQIESGIHSNSYENATGIISWDGQGEDAFINGEVTTASSFATAITATGGTFNTLNTETGRGARQFPNVDVDLAILVGRNATVLNPTGGTTVVSGTDHKYGGGVINGDLELRGVNLFVNGDLEVNGTIKGSGAIYVKGNTSFRGNAELGMSGTEVLALFSKGNVKLEGFDGSQYLEARAAENASFQTWNDQAKWAHGQIMETISSTTNYTNSVTPPTAPPPYVDETTDAPNGTWGNEPGNVIDQLRIVLGEDNPTETYPGTESNTLEKMAVYLETNFAGNESADFLVKRLRDIRPLYQNKLDAALPETTMIANYNSNPSQNLGLLDALNDNYDSAAARRAAGQSRVMNFNKLGTSYFQGVVYTNGAVYASNEVDIVGALLAEKKRRSPQGSWDVKGDGSVVLNAGDVYLGGGSSLVYNKELLEDPFAGSSFGPVVICSWLGN